MLLANNGGSSEKVYVEDVFSTYLYTGNNSTQTITNGIDLAGKGGMVWMKSRSGALDNVVFDTARGTNSELRTNATNGNIPQANGVTAFNAAGFSLGNYYAVNGPSTIYVSWTFRKQPKFFDVVTYTGTGAVQNIDHSLGSVPGCIIVKKTSGTDNWCIYHRSLGNTKYLIFTTDAAFGPQSNIWNNTDPTASEFTVGTANSENGATYVAYLFAHDAGGFGESGTDNVISCGSYVGTGATPGPTVTLGWEPQWVFIKNTSNTGNWIMFDVLRGMPVGATDAELRANSSAAELNALDRITPTARGFILEASGSDTNEESATYIYIAIRRGPMKVPESGTSVFRPDIAAASTSINVGFVPDSAIIKSRIGTTTNGSIWASRLLGDAHWLRTNTTEVQGNSSGSFIWSSKSNYFTQNILSDSPSYPVNYLFLRAPGFFDVVCYTGTGVARTVAHNLGVVPEMMIVKQRSATGNWRTYVASEGPTRQVVLNAPDGSAGAGVMWNSTSPTSSQFSLGNDSEVNASAGTYVAYLFATVAGVSKVGSYTGTGTTLQVNCGFTGGARFVLIKRTDSTGDWYVWDSARGIVAANDPHLSLNTTAAEITTNDSIDPDTTGFVVNQLAATNVNVGPAFSNTNISAGSVSLVQNGRSVNGKLILCGGDVAQTAARIYSATDNATYTLYTGSSINYISDIAYGNGRYVVVGAQNPTNTSKILYSTNLSSWTEASHPALSYGYSRVVFGNGVFVSAGNNNGGAGNYVTWSSDGITWNTTTVPSAVHYLSFVNGIFVASSSTTSTLYTSTNGATWSTVSTGMPAYSPRCDVVYGAGVYVMARSDGYIVYSSNLSSWTDGQNLYMDANVAIGYNSITNRFLAVGNNQDNGTEYAYQSAVGSATGFTQLQAEPTSRGFKSAFVHDGGMATAYQSGGYTYDRPSYVFLAIA